MIGYLKEPSSALSLTLMISNVDSTLDAALHHSVPTDMRQRYFDQYWSVYMKEYGNHSMRKEAVALGVKNI